jgi:anaerobic magnesium-protoporphyrin IX monomethyl ester cyclase
MFNVALVSFFYNDIAIQTLSSYLKINGYNAICFFCPGTLNSFNQKEFIKIIRDRDVAMIGINVYTESSHKAAILTKVMKENNVNIPIIWGGPHVNVMPEECLRYADMVCMGEGEEALLELVKSMSTAEKPNTHIRNIWFRVGDNIIRNDLRELENDLDKYTYHNYDPENQYLIRKDNCETYYEKYLLKEYPIVTSRGCPYDCSYCYNNYRRKQYHGKGRYLRFRSIDKVILELIEAKDRYKGLKRIHFLDDLFISRAITEIKQFQELYSNKIGLPFHALIDFRSFDKEKITILKDSGLNSLQIGIQTGCESVNRGVYNRQISNKKFLEMAKFLNQLGGINVMYDLIFNNPYEKIEDIKDTIELLLELPQPFTINGYNLIFFPGTDITERALRDGFISQNTDENIFSTITDLDNSPLYAKAGSVFSNRYYKINFKLGEKVYWNKIFILLRPYYSNWQCYNRYRHVFIKFFAKSDTFSKRIILNWCIVIGKLIISLRHKIDSVIGFIKLRLSFLYKSFIRVAKSCNGS